MGTTVVDELLAPDDSVQDVVMVVVVVMVCSDVIWSSEKVWVVPPDV
jgi:hypothetical protein